MKLRTSHFPSMFY